MENNSSAAGQTHTTNDTPIYRSRTRLLVGALAWALATCFFAYLSWRVHNETGKLVFALFITAWAVWQTVRCLKATANLETPALIFTRAGLKLENGTVIAWDSIQANKYINNIYCGITFAKRIQLKVGKPSKPVLIPATAMQMSGDDYLALCERYSAAT